MKLIRKFQAITIIQYKNLGGKKYGLSKSENQSGWQR